MKSLALLAAALLVIGPLAAASLTRERTIPLPGVAGRIDHFAGDAAGGRLFVAALGNNTVEVVDLNAGKVVQTITGLAEPQGIFYLGELNRLYVANGDDGTLRAFDGQTFAPVAAVKLDDDADNVRYDPRAKQILVGHGSGGLAIVDAASGEIVADIPLSAHPESFQLEKSGGRVFVNVPRAAQIAVVDRQRKKVISTWPVTSAGANFPMALDEADHRLMIGCRAPGRLLVFDTESGREVAGLGLHGDCDDLFFDPPRRQLYASCGAGFIDVFTQTAPDHYEPKEVIKTERGARTGFFDGERLYLAVPKRGDQSAELRCYRVGK